MEHTPAPSGKSWSSTETGARERGFFEEALRTIHDSQREDRPTAVRNALQKLIERLNTPQAFADHVLGGAGLLSGNGSYLASKPFKVCIPAEFGRDTVKVSRDRPASFLPLSNGSIFVNNEHSIHILSSSPDGNWKEQVLWARHPTVLQSHSHERERVRQLPDGSLVVQYDQKLHTWARNSSQDWVLKNTSDLPVSTFDVTPRGDVVFATPDGRVCKATQTSDGSLETSQLFHAAQVMMIRSLPDEQLLLANSLGFIHTYKPNDGWSRASLVSSSWDPSGACSVLPDQSVVYLSAEYPGHLIIKSRTDAREHWFVAGNIDPYCAVPRSVQALPGRKLLVQSDSEVVLHADDGQGRWTGRKLVLSREHVAGVHATSTGSLLVATVARDPLTKSFAHSTCGLVTKITEYRNDQR